MNGFIIFILVLAGLILIAWQVSNLVAMYFGAPFIRTPDKTIKDILELAEIKPGDKFFELGSGWGSILAHASNKYQAYAYGIEVSPFHYVVSSLRNYSNKLVKIRLADFNDFSLNRADVVYCKLSRGIMKKLEKKFKTELKKGARLITFGHILPNTEYKFSYQVGKDKVYYYQF